MRFAGLTALVDAAIVFVAWHIVFVRHPRTGHDASLTLAVRYFSSYLFFVGVSSIVGFGLLPVGVVYRKRQLKTISSV